MKKKRAREPAAEEWIQKQPPDLEKASAVFQRIRYRFGLPPYRRRKAGRPQVDPKADQ